MKKHSPADWARLGQAVHEARTERGLGKTRDWVLAVGRSERTLLELERGGKVGSLTLEDIEDALGWPRAGTYRVLGGLPWRELEPAAAPVADADLAEAIQRIERRLTAIEKRLGKAGSGSWHDASSEDDQGADAPHNPFTPTGASDDTRPGEGVTEDAISPSDT